MWVCQSCKNIKKSTPICIIFIFVSPSYFPRKSLFFRSSYKLPSYLLPSRYHLTVPRTGFKLFLFERYLHPPKIDCNNWHPNVALLRLASAKWQSSILLHHEYPTTSLDVAIKFPLRSPSLQFEAARSLEESLQPSNRPYIQGSRTLLLNHQLSVQTAR